MADPEGGHPLPRKPGSGSAVLEQICGFCVQVLDVDGAGVSMMTEGGHRATMCASDDVAARIEELQFILGEGPCVDTFNSREPVLVPDIHAPHEGAAERWPGFIEAATQAGVRSLFAFPLRIGAIRLGALDLYRRQAAPLTEAQFKGGLVAADAAALALLPAGGDQAQEFAAPPLSGASYRLEVHQAVGMLKVQLAVTIEAALLQLRAYAFAHGRPINDVAADVVSRRLRFPVEDG